MKKIGLVVNYDGKFGIIRSEEYDIEFIKKDISFKQDISVGDLVEFRVEEKLPNLKLARNIQVIKKNILK